LTKNLEKKTQKERQKNL